MFLDISRKMKRFAGRFELITNQYYILTVVPLTKFLFGFYSGLIGSVMIPIGREFNVDLKTLSMIFPFFSLGQFVTIFFVGYIADKYGKKPVQIICLLLFGLITLFYLKVSNYYLLLVLFFFLGIFGNSVNIMGDATISDAFTDNKGFHLSIAHTYFGVGAAIAPLVFIAAYSRTNDFRSVYLILFIIAFVIFFLIFLVKYPTANMDHARLSVLYRILKDKDFMFLCVYFAMVLGIQGTISGWMPTLFQKNMHISEHLSNYALSFLWFSMVAGRILTAFISRKIKEITLIKIYNAIFFVLLSVSFFLNSYYLLLSTYMLLGLATGGLAPLVIAYNSVIYKDYTSTRIGLLFAVSCIGTLFFPTIVGILGDFFVIYKVISFTGIFFLFYLFYFIKKQ
jgi:MFS transporter, FHS family, glucose/mannose:H+ symporter